MYTYILRQFASLSKTNIPCCGLGNASTCAEVAIRLMTNPLVLDSNASQPPFLTIGQLSGSSAPALPKEVIPTFVSKTVPVTTAGFRQIQPSVVAAILDVPMPCPLAPARVGMPEEFTPPVLVILITPVAATIMRKILLHENYESNFQPQKGREE